MMDDMKPAATREELIEITCEALHAMGSDANHERMRLSNDDMYYRQWCTRMLLALVRAPVLCWRRLKCSMML